jgi:tetratricopeptide (TPR) repeat protein
MGRNEEAVKAYDKALEIDPSKDSWVQESKGLALAALGKEREAAKSYNKALEPYDKAIEAANSTQNLSEAWAQKGFVLQEQGKYEEAIKSLDNATKIDPQNAMAWKMKGAVLRFKEVGRYEEAIQAFDKALQIDPKDAQAWNLKGQALKALGQNSEADAAFAKAKELGYQG